MVGSRPRSTAPRRAAGLVLAALLAAGCSGSDDDPPASTTAQRSSPTATPQALRTPVPADEQSADGAAAEPAPAPTAGPASPEAEPAPAPTAGPTSPEATSIGAVPAEVTSAPRTLAPAPAPAPARPGPASTGDGAPGAPVGQPGGGKAAASPLRIPLPTDRLSGRSYASGKADLDRGISFACGGAPCVSVVKVGTGDPDDGQPCDVINGVEGAEVEVGPDGIEQPFVEVVPGGTIRVLVGLRCEDVPPRPAEPGQPEPPPAGEGG